MLDSVNEWVKKNILLIIAVNLIIILWMYVYAEVFLAQFWGIISAILTLLPLAEKPLNDNFGKHISLLFLLAFYTVMLLVLCKGTKQERDLKDDIKSEIHTYINEQRPKIIDSLMGEQKIFWDTSNARQIVRTYDSIRVSHIINGEIQKSGRSLSKVQKSKMFDEGTELIREKKVTGRMMLEVMKKRFYAKFTETIKSVYQSGNLEKLTEAEGVYGISDSTMAQPRFIESIEGGDQYRQFKFFIRTKTVDVSAKFQIISCEIDSENNLKSFIYSK